jgi:hypothetical protein
MVRASVLLAVAAILLGLISAAGGSAAANGGGGPGATVAKKKCKKHGHKRKCKKKRHGNPAAAPAAFTITPASYDFGTLSGASSFVSFTLKNVGGKRTGSLTVSSSGYDGFLWNVGQCYLGLSPGASCEFMVQALGDSPGSYHGTITLGDDSGIAPVTLTLDVTQT